MLSKLNELYGKLIYENSEDRWIRQITNDNDFLKVYLLPLQEKYCVNTVKARLNTFRIGGLYKNVIEALSNFKVDADFWNDEIMQREFVLYSPMITFGEVIHDMGYSEGYPLNCVAPNSLYALQDKYRISVEGRWYEPKELDKNTEFDYPVRAKFATPTDLCKMIDNLREELGYTEDAGLIVEFQVNCENLANQLYDEHTAFIPVCTTQNETLTDAKNTLTDKINDVENKDVEPTAKCELPKEKTENNVKVPVSQKNGQLSLKKAYVNEYDAKNKYKRITKEVK
jgi:hypothetical protein